MNTKRKKNNRLWTYQEEYKLKTMAGKIPVVEIAKKLGRTRQSVLGKAHLMQLSLFHVESHPFTKFSQNTYKQAMRLYDLGFSCTAIAKDLEISRHIVSKWVNFACRTGISLKS